jgi:hypothetical protein
MTQQEKQIKIAERCGWRCTNEGWISPGNIEDFLPDYFDDLNAAHEMEEAIPSYMVGLYEKLLSDVSEGFIWRATAAQRAEAFGIVMGLWKEGE